MTYTSAELSMEIGGSDVVITVEFNPPIEADRLPVQFHVSIKGKPHAFSSVFYDQAYDDPYKAGADHPTDAGR